ncbi:MAG: homocysteine S-methyltransferase family protein [Candidatus Sabulitectum sp.]|nr:homocysteine S-methyltransferase family protein [Candidatus Sabulitectum sp.]
MDSAKQLRNLLAERIVFLDGAMGTMLMNRGMPVGVSTEIWASEHPKDLSAVHSSYIEAGSDIILACTFGGSRIKLGSQTAQINRALAETAISSAGGKAIAAASIGPSGKMIRPVGDAEWMDIYNSFLIQTRALVEAGINVFFLETFTDPRELKAAILATRDASPDGFISAHLTFSDNGRSGAGTSPTALALLCNQLAVDAVGANCSTGPEGLLPVISEMARFSNRYITVEPNAGLPDSSGNYEMSPDQFAAATEEMAWGGASIIGGCCGTTPEHITALRRAVGIRATEDVEKETLAAFTSVDSVVPIGGAMLMVGEAVNPTGRKELKKAIRRRDPDHVISMARAQEKADLLDINLGLERLVPDGLLDQVFSGLCIGPPLSVDLSSPENIEAAFNQIGGIGLLNSLMATEGHIEERVGILLRHGGYAVLLPIDENGLAETPEERLAVVKKGIAILERYGFSRSRVFADPIVKALATGADPKVTLKTLRLFKKEGILTIAGVSNVSHGLPHRAGINAAFLATLCMDGLDAGIVNVLNPVTAGITAGAAALCGRVNPADIEIPDDEQTEAPGNDSLLRKALLKGDTLGAKLAATLLLESGTRAASIVNECLAPAMDKLGSLYSKKKLFLPHLIAGAEAAKALMEILKPHIASNEEDNRGTIVLATVKGDIHDIGKNLVSLFLSNAGFLIIDLGKDISSEAIVEAVKAHKADAVALSALMSTTASRMEEVIQLLEQNNLQIPVLIGGAVVTKEFASQIGAFYAKDAYSAVESAGKMLNCNLP